MTSWDVHHPPRADGRTVLVTGGNAGIGYFVAEQLVGAGATVMLGCRDAGRAEAAMTAIRSRHPEASLGFLPLDLSDLASLRTFAVNHLGNFALTAWLAPYLSPASRVVTTGSFVAKSAEFSAHEHNGKRAYARSKLAQMLFGFELARRGGVVSVVNHPGGALGSLTPSRPPVHTRPSRSPRAAKGVGGCGAVQRGGGDDRAVHGVVVRDGRAAGGEKGRHGDRDAERGQRA